jgi:uncharacterized protein YecE (DUF72 family)
VEFGKLNDITTVDFTLPPSHALSSAVLSDFINHSLSNIYVGCTGWAMPQWNGTWYPKNTNSKQFLKAYSQQFNTIEHNTTHYRIPDAATVLKWKEESTPDFKFCPKIPQTISHHQHLGINGQEVTLFCENISLLGEKMGCCFMQLPPHFGYERFGVLEHFFHQWDKKIPLAVEVRNEKVFENRTYFDRFFSLLEQYNISSVITDVSGRRDVLHQRLTTTTCMVRFVGNDLHRTDYQRVDAWVMQLLKWIEEGLQNLYFFSHQPDNLRSPEMALYFIEQLQQLRPTIALRKPKRIEEKPTEQMSLF